MLHMEHNYSDWVLVYTGYFRFSRVRKFRAMRWALRGLWGRNLTDVCGGMHYLLIDAPKGLPHGKGELYMPMDPNQDGTTVQHGAFVSEKTRRPHKCTLFRGVWVKGEATPSGSKGGVVEADPVTDPMVHGEVSG